MISRAGATENPPISYFALRGPLKTMEKTRSSRGSVEDEEDEEEEFARKDGCACSHKGEIGKMDGKRSKHSATEQRRRSKINDRFQKLRDLIPNSSDQKRDKASFLLEVVEYIQFLQEKVHKYETALPGWNQGSMKLATWKHGQGPGGSTADHSQVIKNGPATGYMFDRKIDDSSISVSPSVLTNAQNLVESNSLNTVSPYKPMNHHLGFTGKGGPVPMSLQQNMYAASVGRSGGIAQPPQRLTSDTENMASQSQPQTWPRSYPTNNDMLSEQEELTIEGGTVRMSSVYSQGLLNSFSQALQNSGIDLSQASISVQIDIGKRAISRPSTTTSGAKDHEEPSAGNRAMVHSRVASNCEDSDQAQKRFKKDNS